MTATRTTIMRETGSISVRAISVQERLQNRLDAYVVIVGDLLPPSHGRGVNYDDDGDGHDDDARWQLGLQRR